MDFTSQTDPVMQGLYNEVEGVLNSEHDLKDLDLALAKLHVYADNQTPGLGTGCPDCNGRGFTFVLKSRENGPEEVCVFCHCYERYKSHTASNLPERFAGVMFKEDTPTAKLLYKHIVKFLNGPDGRWFFAGGTPGSGKTHAATYIAQELVKQGKTTTFRNWVSTYKKIQGVIHDGGDVQTVIDPMLNAEVLVIDDVFRKVSSQYELQVLYDIFNHRYANGLVTVITSERTLKEIREDVDAGIAGRIAEMAEIVNIENKAADRRWKQ